MKKILNMACILLLILFSFAFSTDIKDAISQKQKELENINQLMIEQKNNLNKTEKQAKDVYFTIKAIESDLEKQNQNHVRVNTQINKTTTEIGDLEAKIVQEKTKYNLAIDSLKNKLDQYYRLSNANILENLFEINSLTEYMNELYFFEAMVTANVQFLTDVAQKKEELAYHENKLGQKLGVLKEKVGFIEILKEQIKDNKQKKEKLYNDLLAQKKEYDKNIKELERDSQEIFQLITKMQKQAKSTARIGDGRFIWPVIGEISSPFGERIHPIFKVRSVHTGVDIQAPSGRPVFAASDGVILFSGTWGGYGKAIIIDHGASMTTLYGHLSQYFVKKGIFVKKGQIIGLVGSTGWSTGPHLHFEIRVEGKETDPIKYLPKQ